MLADTDDTLSPVDQARRLSVQAELLALNAAIESARGGADSAQFRALAEEARRLARRGRAEAQRQALRLAAREAAGAVLGDGFDGPGSQGVASPLRALADRIDPIGRERGSAGSIGSRWSH